jgi:hypothetical protein
MDTKSLRLKYRKAAADRGELARAKRVDLITLPASVEGTNCGNCEYVEGTGDVLYCRHPEVRQNVTRRMCCALWDHPRAERAWE